MTVSSNLLSLIYTETLFFYHCYVIAWSNFAACLDWKKYDHVFWYYRRIQLIALKSQNILTRLIIKHLRKYLINNFKKYRILLFEMMPVCLYLQSRNNCRNITVTWMMNYALTMLFLLIVVQQSISDLRDWEVRGARSDVARGRQRVQGEQGEGQGAGDGGQTGQGQTHSVGQRPGTIWDRETGDHLVTSGARTLLDGDGGWRGGGGETHRLSRKTQTGAWYVGSKVRGQRGRGAQTHSRLSLNDCYPGSTHLKMKEN